MHTCLVAHSPSFDGIIWQMFYSSDASSFYTLFWILSWKYVYISFLSAQTPSILKIKYSSSK